MAAKTYLAGDLGGTKTFLALYRDVDGQLEQAHSHRYISAEWRGTADQPVLDDE